MVVESFASDLVTAVNAFISSNTNGKCTSLLDLEPSDKLIITHPLPSKEVGFDSFARFISEVGHYHATKDGGNPAESVNIWTSGGLVEIFKINDAVFCRYSEFFHENTLIQIQKTSGIITISGVTFPFFDSLGRLAVTAA